MSEPSFAAILGFDLTDALLHRLAEDGITSPTPVQCAVIPPILEGRHVVIHSGTGTGKTLAYVLPLLQRLREGAEGRVVIIAPAAELVAQTRRTIEHYAAGQVSVGAMVAGGSYKQQKLRVQKSTKLIVGTPGRVLEAFAQRSLKGVTTVVLDEPDPVLASKDAAFLREVLSRPPRVRLILAAATLGAQAEQLVSEFMVDSVRPEVSDNPLVERIVHRVVSVPNPGEKDVRLARLILDKKVQKAIVFVNDLKLVRHLFRFFDEQGLNPATVSQERSKQDCQRALSRFARSEARLLVTTDKAATGLDIADVPWVFHYELPTSAAAYLHRAGRTGRAGKAGHSVVMICGGDERNLLNRYARQLGIDVQPWR